MNDKPRKTEQDRNAFRVNLPEDGISAKFNIQRVDNVEVKMAGRIANLSAGGMGLVTTDNLKVGAAISGVIVIEHHKPIEVSANVVDVRTQLNLQNKEDLLRACRFTNMTATLDQKIAALVNDLHRKLYTRYSK